MESSLHVGVPEPEITVVVLGVVDVADLDGHASHDDGHVSFMKLYKRHSPWDAHAAHDECLFSQFSAFLRLTSTSTGASAAIVCSDGSSSDDGTTLSLQHRAL